MERSEIVSNLETVRQRVAKAARRSGRSPSAVELLVVSKTWPAGVVSHVVESGHELLGENKLQEAELKIPDLPPSVRWHFIGRLQRNKARKALALFEAIHSVDTLRLAAHLSRIAGEMGKTPRIYLQVNLDQEESKGGFSVSQLREDLPELLSMPHLYIAGLMSIPPAVEDPEKARCSFRKLREFRDRLEGDAGVEIEGLSMGMSHDFEVAIEEGATIVRVGSSVFGPRSQRALS